MLTFKLFLSSSLPVITPHTALVHLYGNTQISPACIQPSHICSQGLCQEQKSHLEVRHTHVSGSEGLPKPCTCAVSNLSFKDSTELFPAVRSEAALWLMITTAPGVAWSSSAAQPFSQHVTHKPTIYRYQLKCRPHNICGLGRGWEGRQEKTNTYIK